MVKSAENWFGNNAMAGANLMATGRRCEAIGRWIRNAGPEAGVWAPAIVVTDPVASPISDRPVPPIDFLFECATG